MKKILVAHDGSDTADRALFKAAVIARKFAAALTVISVVPDLCFAEIGVDCATVNTLYRAEIEGIMEGVREMMEEESIEAETIILQGNAAETIVDHARGMNIDLIVIGSTGKHATGRMVFGGVSSKVVADAPCSVLVVK